MDDLASAPWLRRLLVATLLAGLIVLLALVFVVLRPLVRGLLASPKSAYVPAALADGAAALAGNGADARTAVDYETQISQARSLVAQDPARVAQVVKTWVGKDE